MTKLFFLIILLVVGGVIYFTSQNINNTPSTQEVAQPTDSLLQVPETLEPEKDIEPVVEESPPPAPTPKPNQGIDTLPPPEIIEEPDTEAPPPNANANPDPVTVIIFANDITANPKTITAEKDTQVTLIFQVDSKNVYFGGLDFRSPVINTGTINAGQSETVTFTALASFEFTPYWPASQVAKDYQINIVVE
jgi:hypothetical protein